MEELWRLSATDIAALIRSKKVSAKQAASAALARLDAVNPSINAVVDHRPEDVLAQAAAIDAAIARKPKGHDFIIDRRHAAPALARPMSMTGG